MEDKMCKQCGSELRLNHVKEYQEDDKNKLHISYVCGNKNCSLKDVVQLEEDVYVQ